MWQLAINLGVVGGRLSKSVVLSNNAEALAFQLLCLFFFHKQHIEYRVYMEKVPLYI